MRKLDPTIPYMILDIVKETLSASGDINKLEMKLTSQIREFTGAKVVALVEFTPDKNHFHLNYVNPTRYSDRLSTTLIGMLLDVWYDYNNVTSIYSNETESAIKDFLEENNFKKNLVCPLIARDKKVGILLVLGLFDDNIMKQIRMLFDVLLHTVALIIENSKLIRDQEKIIETRTFELQNALEEAKSANIAKSTFLSNMSHEIRTPLNSVLGFTEILKERETDSKKAHFIDNIQTSGRSLLNIINDILDLSKIEAGKQELHYDSTSIRTMLIELNKIFAIKAEEKAINFIIDCSNDIPDNLIIDEKHLRQVIMNLISNAIKFTTTGYVRVGVYHKIDDQKTDKLSLTISVTDTGIGIREDQREKIFGSFTQADGQVENLYGGTGLGLSISRQLVEMMGGKIKVESQVNKGSIFTIILNNVKFTTKKDYNISLKTTDLSTISQESISFKPATILIADDVAYNLEVLEAYLDKFNFTIIKAENGIETLKKARQYIPDVILLDMKMPVMDGYEVSQKLKEIEECRKIPIIAVTASALKQNEEHISKLCNGYISKPINKTELIDQLVKYLPQEDEIKPIIPILNKKNLNLELFKNSFSSYLEELNENALIGDFSNLKDIIENISKKDKDSDPLCKILIELADNYDINGIIKLLDSLR